MSVKISLSRTGKKHTPFYRVVAVDSRKKRDGEILANIGTYDALKSTVVRFSEELYTEWVSKGAQPTDSAKKIFKQYKKTGASDSVVAPVEVVEKSAPKKVVAKKAETNNVSE